MVATKFYKVEHEQFSSPNCAMIIKGDFCKKWSFYLHSKLTVRSGSVFPDISASTAEVKVVEIKDKKKLVEERFRREITNSENYFPTVVVATQTKSYWPLTSSDAIGSQ